VPNSAEVSHDRVESDAQCLWGAQVRGLHSQKLLKLGTDARLRVFK
jgi:hypothetical protein